MNDFAKKVKNFWQQRLHSSHARSFREDQNREKAYDTCSRGTQEVLLEQIVGSVGRYHDFDSRFRLHHYLPDDKLKHVTELLKGGVTLPPVTLYQIKDEYYVLDGNHRVAAAKELKHTTIAACIVEFLPSPTTLENVLYRERHEFLEQTGLREEIELTEVGQYRSLCRQIRDHQEFLQATAAQSVGFQEAATDWFHTIYSPLIALLRKGRLLDAFPQRTLSDLYTYISSQQWHREQQQRYSREIDQLIPCSMEEFREKMAQKTEREYPDMVREMTVFVLMNVTGKHEDRIIDKVFDLPEVQEVHSVYGSVDLIAKIVLSRDLLTSDVETISHFVNDHIRHMPGIISTQTLIPGLSKMKEQDR
ncbi:transcriptional regulator [candidate division KSB3 bacterium]|uniref:Transcriptional regulator n=1 Tax=candidate division KSB3 bacterium TaxID=2044937 RepID=A0A2G6E5R8_9BACT|nr:MAG: transcriptional regulator [candidate division KSB3 bacterium]PIE29939.1 MAG: transcriptional regulator [candidate division KSB3 bacterium]